ncbi:MAG: hypothetical protein Q9227_008445 [Pyrenula ochraceoflavens]
MDPSKDGFAAVLSGLQADKNASEISGATSPGCEPRDVNGAISNPILQPSRHRPRTYPYFRYLPYEVEDEERRSRDLEEILKHLYIAVEAGDFSPGAVHWTRELRSWLGLKFDPDREQRIKLVKLYYELALAPGIDPSVSERFASMFMMLTKRKHYLRPLVDLTLDWRILYREIKIFVLPQESGLIQSTYLKRNIKTLTKLCSFAQLYFDPKELPAMLDEFLPYFSGSFTETGFVVVGLLNLFLPTASGGDDYENLRPQNYLPTYFHLWSLMNRSKNFDINFLDLFSRLARDSLPSKNIPFSEFGIFTHEQTTLIYTAILRLLEIPVGQSTSPYSATVDVSSGLGILLDRDSRKHPVSHHIARWIVMSLSPACLESNESILSFLEGLIQAVETFFHPSNSGSWTRTLAQLVFYLGDFFIMRWNRERNGEMDVPASRQLNEALKKRYVLCLRDVTFMGIYAKSGTAMSFSLSTLQSLAYLEPDLVLPGALQRIYPSMQGLVEVHRTTSSLRSLQVLARTMIRTKGYRCHITALLGLALPGIDANDLEKSLITLSFITAVCYNIPFADLSKGQEEFEGNLLAMQWITGEMERMEREGAGIELNYSAMDDKEEEMILRSSTAGFGEFITSFLGRIFTLLENLPDAARLRSGSPEENIVNTLPAAFTPLLASLSPELFDLALHKIVDFIANHVIHQARDAMAFICNSLCKVNPEKALDKLIPVLVRAIKTEIDENGAGSTRNAASDVLPRDRGLVWNVSMLSMCVVHVGDAVLKHKAALLEIAVFMQSRCKGMPTVHISNFVHHLLLNLTVTYTMDYSLFEPNQVEGGFSIEVWGMRQDPAALTPRWHLPNQEEVGFACELFGSQAHNALSQLRSLIDGTSSIKREGSGKEWSDEVSRNLVLLRLIISGVSVLFDAKGVSEGLVTIEDGKSADSEMMGMNGHTPEEQSTGEDSDSALDGTDESSIKPSFQYPTGYVLTKGDSTYTQLHEIRQQIGRTLHDVHTFLAAEQEDDMLCFVPLFTAYRSWFVDVGIERTAHVLDRVTKLYAADLLPYKISGVRKDYPRPILIRRANVYHLQRLRHNAAPRARSELDEQLLLDLAKSSVSLYTEVRRNAQSAGEAALKVIFGARLLVIPPLIDAFRKAVKQKDFPRIKGGLFALLFGSLAKTVGRHWKYTPTVIRTFIEASEADKPSIQKMCTGGVFQVVDYGRAQPRMAILDEAVVKAIAPNDDVSAVIAKKKAFSVKKRTRIEQKKYDLAEELIGLARASHWKKALRTVSMVMALGMRFEHICSDNMIDLISTGAVDPHPGLRGMYSQTLMAIFTMINIRAACSHSYANYVQGIHHFPAKLNVTVKADDPEWTQKFLSDFGQADAEFYVDHDYPGWLVWGKTMPAYKANNKTDVEFDDLEWEKRKTLGKYLTRSWYSTFFGYLKQEPRDSSADKFRMTSSLFLAYTFELMIRDGLTAATFDEIKEETLGVFEEGSDKHQHRATAEILGSMVSAVMDLDVEKRTKVWEFVFPIIRKVFSDGLTPENLGYWTTFLHMILQSRDPRRAWPLLDWLASFRLDMGSNAAFKESSKINLLHQCMADSGWHFQLDRPVSEDFLTHIDHPYKGVREAIGHSLATITRTRYHESFQDVTHLVEAQKAASSIGAQPYRPTEEFSSVIQNVFQRIHKWRENRPAGQQTPSSYTSGSKTVLLWLDSILSSHECTQLLSFFPSLFTEEFLHMMEVREDPELQSLAYHVFRHLPNIPHRIGEDKELIDTLMRIGSSSTSWHQRLRVMINMQIIFFRRLFLLSKECRTALFNCVTNMLQDVQHEVRAGASATLSGMIRCSPAAWRNETVFELKARFTKLLDSHPLPKKPRNKPTGAAGSSSVRSSGTSTPTPEQQRLVITRHAAVLGLGALVQAFPYTSPPPEWMPGVLTTMSNKAAADPGIVGGSVKQIISDFKKTRQDTWFIDVKAFRPEQLEDLSGVLWKSYFA